LCGCALSPAEHDRMENMTEMSIEGAIVSVRMYSHTIVYFYIRTSENLVNVGSSRHKLPRHLQFCVGDTDPLAKIGATRRVLADMLRHVGNISS
jgi:hypothetical protein